MHCANGARGAFGHGMKIDSGPFAYRSDIHRSR